MLIRSSRVFKSQRLVVIWRGGGVNFRTKNVIRYFMYRATNRYPISSRESRVVVIANRFPHLHRTGSYKGKDKTIPNVRYVHQIFLHL